MQNRLGKVPAERTWWQNPDLLYGSSPGDTCNKLSLFAQSGGFMTVLDSTSVCVQVIESCKFWFVFCLTASTDAAASDANSRFCDGSMTNAITTFGCSWSMSLFKFVIMEVILVSFKCWGNVEFKLLEWNFLLSIGRFLYLLMLFLIVKLWWFQGVELH